MRKNIEIEVKRFTDFINAVETAITVMTKSEKDLSKFYFMSPRFDCFNIPQSIEDYNAMYNLVVEYRKLYEEEGDNYKNMYFMLMYDGLEGDFFFKTLFLNNSTNKYIFSDYAPEGMDIYKSLA